MGRANAPRVDRHRIDAQIPSKEVLLQTDLWAGVKHEAFIALPRLSFGSCQRVFGLGRRMKKDRKISAHWTKTGSCHVIWAGSCYQVISIECGLSQQAVSNRPAHTVNLDARRQTREEGVASLGCKRRQSLMVHRP